jgi:adenylosuccinate lyase
MINCTPNAHITDSQFYRAGYTTDEARRIFCDRYRYQRWLDIEAALALAQAELGMIPQWAADAINEKAQLRFLNPDAIQKGVLESSHSLLPLLRGLESVCESNAGQFIHFGATTQDIQDTAQALEIRDVLGIVKRDLAKVMELVAGLAGRHENLVMIGRTHSQHALPMTLGLKMAVWLDELGRNLDRLVACEERVLVSQLFGGVGTMDAFGKKGIALLSRFSERLGLKAPLAAWHVARDRGAEFLSTMALIGGTLGRIADEIRSLARSETGELEEPFTMGKVGSSTMPHKRNPEISEQVVVLARLIKANAGLGFEGMINEHERDYRTVRLEWVTVTDTSLYVCGALALMKTLLEGLVVREEKIRKHVQQAAAFVCTEALMFLLGEKIGKQRAHQVIYEASMEAIETEQALMDVLMDRAEIKDEFRRADLEKAVEPANHIGLSRELTRRVIDDATQKLNKMDIGDGGERICPLSQEGRCIV